MRLIGILMIFFCITTIFRIISSRLKKRVEELELANILFLKIYNSIKYLKKPITILLKEISNEPEFNRFSFILTCNNFCLNGISLNKAWKDSIQKESLKLSFNNQDLKIIKSVSNWLGTTDIEGQEVQFKNLFNIISEQISSAKKEFNNYSKPIKTIGILTAIFVCILII